MTPIPLPSPTKEDKVEVRMEFWRAWSIPASGPEFPQAGLMDSLETVDGEIRISIRVLNVGTPEAAPSVEGEANPS